MGIEGVVTAARHIHGRIRIANVWLARFGESAFHVSSLLTNDISREFSGHTWPPGYEPNQVTSRKYLQTRKLLETQYPRDTTRAWERAQNARRRSPGIGCMPPPSAGTPLRCTPSASGSGRCETGAGVCVCHRAGSPGRRCRSGSSDRIVRDVRQQASRSAKYSAVCTRSSCSRVAGEGTCMRLSKSSTWQRIPSTTRANFCVGKTCTPMSE